jgi:putative tricarboxylic transport membrane protein
MEVLQAALLEVIQPASLVVLMASVIAGIVIGAIPGLTVTLAVALAVPLTITMSPTASILMLISLYGAGIYGGSISAILLNAPGTPASAATSLDGYALGRQGKAGKALKMALYASVYGGLFSTAVLILLAPQLAAVALRFGPIELACLLLFSLTVVGSLSGNSMIKGLLAAALGMGLATIGADPMTAVPRFTFGSYDLFDGLAYIPLLIGLFALAEMLVQAQSGFVNRGEIVSIGHDRAANRIDADDARRCAVPLLRSGFLGVFVGMLPGLGASIATFLGYAETRRASREPERFGRGAIEGVAASEAANNAVTGSALIPLLALSIPGDVVTAILLGALLIQGVTPGPLIFTSRPDIVYTVYLALLASNLVILLVGAIAIRPLTRVLAIPKVFLYPVILVMCAAGSYAIRYSLFDVWVMFGAGILGWLLRLFGLPVAPLLIAFILTGPFEESLRQALIKTEGNLLLFLESPIAAVILALTLAALVFTVRRQSRPLGGTAD